MYHFDINYHNSFYNDSCFWNFLAQTEQYYVYIIYTDQAIQHGQMFLFLASAVRISIPETTINCVVLLISYKAINFIVN